jgi:hypothetical protein
LHRIVRRTRIERALQKIPWLKWLAKASPRQRAAWSLEPGGYAIYWEQLDDGVEICHLLGMESLK